MVPKCEDYLYSSYHDFQKGLIDRKIIEEIYGNDQNYLEKITGDYEKYDFIEVSNEFGKQKLEDFKTVCQEYSNLDFQCEENVYQVAKELKRRCGAMNHQIIDFIGLKRATYYNIMKRQKELDF